MIGPATTNAVTAAAVDAADHVRAMLLRVLCAVHPLRALAVDRGRRLVAMQVGMVLFAAGLALRFPLISLWLGAALFGVPHVVAGLRAVTLRRRATRVTLACAALGGIVGVSQLLGVGEGATRAFVALLLLLVVLGVMRRLCLRQIGGQTGDAAGALEQINEIVVLLTAAASRV